MEDQKLRDELQSMWELNRMAGDMVVDFPSNKVGKPFAVPYEGVCFPVERDGEFVLVSIPVEQVARFALALAEAVPESIALDSACDAEISAHDAIYKAQGKS